MVRRGKRVEGVGYMRTSSAANIGDGKDSEARQRKAIEGYAKAAGMVIVDWFYDAAVSGADRIEARPGFTALLARIAGNGARTIIVETANRFARDLMVQEVGFAMLRDLGVTLIAADSPASFLDGWPNIQANPANPRSGVRVRQGDDRRQAQGRAGPCAAPAGEMRGAQVLCRKERRTRASRACSAVVSQSRRSAPLASVGCSGAC